MAGFGNVVFVFVSESALVSVWYRAGQSLPKAYFRGPTGVTHNQVAIEAWGRPNGVQTVRGGEHLPDTEAVRCPAGVQVEPPSHRGRSVSGWCPSWHRGGTWRDRGNLYRCPFRPCPAHTNLTPGSSGGTDFFGALRSLRIGSHSVTQHSGLDSGQDPTPMDTNDNQNGFCSKLDLYIHIDAF